MSHARIEAMLEESGFDRDEMAGVVDLLAPLDDLADRAPEPSAELAALFGPARAPVVPLAPVSRSRVRNATVGAVVIALSSVGATGLSAAANTLPRPLQHEVAQFSHDHLPFDLPEPPPPGEPFGAEMPEVQFVPGDGTSVPGPAPIEERDQGATGRAADPPGRFPSPSPSAGPTAASASSHPSFMPSPSPTYSSSSSSSGSPSPEGQDYSEPDNSSPSPNQGGEDRKPKRPPKDQHQGFGSDGDGKDHKPGKGKDKDNGGGQGNGNGPSPSDGPANGGGQGQGDGQGDGGEGGGLPDLPPPLALPDPPPPSPSPELVLPDSDLPIDGTLTGGG